MKTPEQYALIEKQLASLSRVYAAWGAAQGIATLGSADEMLFDDRVNDKQRKYLAAFIALWEATEKQFD